MESNQFEMNAQQIAGFTAIGATFADSEVTADEAVLSFTKLVCPEGATTPIYDLWETGSKYWKAGYAEGKKIPLTGADGKENNTVTKAYSRMLAQCCDKYGLIKPTKPTTTAQDKKEQRSKAQVAMDELKAKPMEDLIAEVQMLSASPTLDNLKKASKLQKAVESKRKDLLADRMDGIKAKQKEVKDLAGNCFDEEALEHCLEILLGNVDVSVM